MECEHYKDMRKTFESQVLAQIFKELVKRLYRKNKLPYSAKSTMCEKHFQNLYALFKIVRIQISWLLMKPADQDPHCFYPPDGSMLLMEEHLNICS